MVILPAFAAASLAALGLQAVPVCLPPSAPTVPASDRNFREYADLIAADFEQYFSALSQFTTCLVIARKTAIDEGRQVGKDYRAFVSRAEALGISHIIARPAETHTLEVTP